MRRLHGTQRNLTIYAYYLHTWEDDITCTIWVQQLINKLIHMSEDKFYIRETDTNNSCNLNRLFSQTSTCTDTYTHTHATYTHTCTHLMHVCAHKHTHTSSSVPLPQFPIVIVQQFKVVVAFYWGANEPQVEGSQHSYIPLWTEEHGNEGTQQGEKCTQTACWDTVQQWQDTIQEDVYLAT